MNDDTLTPEERARIYGDLRVVAKLLRLYDAVAHDRDLWKDLWVKEKNRADAAERGARG